MCSSDLLVVEIKTGFNPEAILEQLYRFTPLEESFSMNNVALVAGSPARRIGWVCACGDRLRDEHGAAAPGKPELYAHDPSLHCVRCGRTYRYDPQRDALVERVADGAQGARA